MDDILRAVFDKNLTKNYFKWEKEVLGKWFDDNDTDRLVWYRGVNNASYKIQSSEKVKQISGKSRNLYYKETNDEINSLFTHYNYSNDGLEYPNPTFFAFIQHYGFPSPMIDWTDNNQTAFIFALHEWKRNNDAKISMLNVKKLKKIFDIEYEETTKICTNIDMFPQNSRTSLVPPLLFGKAIDFNGIKKPIPFSGEFMPKYVSQPYVVANKKNMHNPIITRMYYQSGDFVYLPNNFDSLEDALKQKLGSEDLKEVLSTFCIDKKYYNNEVVEKIEIYYKDLFPEQDIPGIKSLDTIKRNMVSKFGENH